MNKRHNLSTVIAFEFLRIIRKKSFWIGTLAVPVFIAVIFGLVYFSNKSTSDKAEAQKDAKFSIIYTDDSKLVNNDVATAFGAKKIADKQTGIRQVQEGKVDAYFYYPADPSKDVVESYNKDAGLFDNSKYTTVAAEMIQASIQTKLGDESLVRIIKEGVQTQQTSYKDGEKTGGIMDVIVPGAFLVAFYVVISFLGNRLLTSTIEEKENRVTEMILTTLNPTTLIVGKIISTFMAGALQLLILSLPAIIGYIFFRTQLNIPSFDLASLTFDPLTIGIGALLLIVGFMVFTGALVTIGAIMPTAQEAGQFFGYAMIFMFAPFWAFTLMLSDPHNIVVTFFTYFPLSAPVTAMIRNAAGTLSPLEGFIVVGELLIIGYLLIMLSVRLFRYGSMEYTKKLSLKTIFTK